jgi:hypothetical protein
MPEVQSRTYANPRRLPRRNHYQEGPDFLFVATQGGRPPGDALRRAQAAVARRRRAALRRWADRESLATICAELSCSRASLFRWRTRYAAGGLEALVDRPRIGRASDLPPALERLILTVRLLTYWNSRRIAAEFRRRGVWPLGHGQVDRLLARHGSHRPSYIRTPGPRYERAAVNELWHIDLKGPFYLLGATGRARTCHFVALVDDHSRFLLGIRAVPTKEAVWILALLEEAVELCGVPHELMTDNGTPFVAIVRTMLSRFQRTVIERLMARAYTLKSTPMSIEEMRSLTTSQAVGVNQNDGWAMSVGLRSALVLDDQGAFGDCLWNEPLRDQLGFQTELEEPRIQGPESLLLVLDRGKAIRVRLDRLGCRPHVLFEIVHRSPLLLNVTCNPVAVTVHVPHNRPLARQITRPHDCPRIIASENLLELGDGLSFSERGLGVIAEGDVVRRVGDQDWPLGLGHAR